MSQIGSGWALAVNDGASSAFVDVDDITELQPPEGVVIGMAESKRLDGGGVVTRVPTVGTPGNFTFTYEHTKTQFERLDALKGTEKNWKVTDITPATPWTRTVPGVLTSHVQQPVSADGIVLVVATVEVTGAAS